MKQMIVAVIGAVLVVNPLFAMEDAESDRAIEGLQALNVSFDKGMIKPDAGKYPVKIDYESVSFAKDGRSEEPAGNNTATPAKPESENNEKQAPENLKYLKIAGRAAFGAVAGGTIGGMIAMTFGEKARPWIYSCALLGATFGLLYTDKGSREPLFSNISEDTGQE
ncbi:hypothetical protein ACFL6Y_02230 [Elusimicrobiota bacterium]